MPSTGNPLQELAQRIEDQESELAELRKELESRQMALAELMRQKEELQEELEKIEAEIEAVSLPFVPASASAAEPVKAKIAKPAIKLPFAAQMSAEANSRVPLHEILTQLLSQSTEPLSAQQLADLALANGYETKSKDLKNVIWVGLGKMNNVERIPGVGYRLKKGYGKKK